MGNNICGEVCAQRKLPNEISLPNMKTIMTKIDFYEISTIITIQKWFRGFKMRKFIKNKFREIHTQKKRSMRELVCDFKDSWELYFDNKTKIEFSINGLYKVKQEISEFYADFFKISKSKNSNTYITNESPNLKEKIIILNDKKIFPIQTSQEFLKVFHIPILKMMNKHFDIGEKYSMYEKINVELERVKLSNPREIEEINTLENEENNVTIENNNEINKDIDTIEINTNTNNNFERTETNLRKEMQKNDSNLMFMKMDDEKVDDLSDKKFQSLQEKHNSNWNINIIDKLIDINHNFIPNQSELSSKKETYVSDFTRISDNKLLTTPTNENRKGSASPRLNFKRNNLKIVTEPSKIESLNASPIKNTIISNYTDLHVDKIMLLNQFDDYTRSKSANVHKNMRNGEIKLEMDNIIEKINAEKEKECTYISFKDKNSVFYQGNWHEKKLCKHGLGYAYMIDKSKGTRYKYYGYFKDDLYHGIGLLLYEDGYYYYGEFRNGLQSGLGMEVTKNSSYVGFFRNGKYNGYGEYNYQGKTFFYGSFRNGLKNGYGLLTMNDGARYCGSFIYNKMHGIGAFHWHAGHRYYGNWKEDKMHGLGCYKWVKGDYYVGYYKNDLRNGHGEYHFKNNDSFLIGKWKNSKKEGKFELHESKNIFSLFYKNDVQID